jgi:hypothetical protein
MIKIYRLLFAALIFFSINLHAQNDTTKSSSVFISKDINYKNAQFVLVLKKDKLLIDTLALKKINPDWIDKVEIVRYDSSIISESTTKPSILIYVKRRYIKDAKDLMNKEK